MQKLINTFRFFVLFAALGCIVVTATNAALFAHLWASSPQECHHEDHDHDHEDEPLNSNHHDHCSICQFLLGSAGKYIYVKPATADFAIEQAPFARCFESQFIYQQEIDLLASRGPPVA